MRFLRTNTAVIVTVGPFYDKTDGVTIETALTITNERITLTADTDAGSAPTNILDNVTGATSGTANDLNYITGNDAGMMQLELAAADVNRLGRMFLSITDAANHVPVFHEFMVLPAAIFDWLILGTIVPLPANVTQWLGSAAATPTVAGVPEVDVTHWIGTAAATPTVAGVPEVDVTHVAGATTDVSTLPASVAAILVDTGTTLDGRIPAALVSGRMDASVGAMAANVMTAAAAAADLTTELQTGLATAAALATVQADTDNIQTRLPAALVSGRIDASVGAMADNTLTAAAVASGALGTAELDPSVIVDIVDAVWDEATAGHTTAGTTGKALTDAGGAGDPWSTALPGAYGAGTAGKIVGDNINATVSSRASQTTLDTLDNFVDTEVADIQARIPAALVSGRMDASVGAMAANTVTAAATAADFLAEVNAEADTALADVGLTTTITGRVDAAVSTRLATAGYTVPPTVTENADALLKRDMSAVTGESARSPLNALRALRNKVSRSGATVTVTKEDDTTSAWTASITTDVAANPITVVDPA